MGETRDLIGIFGAIDRAAAEDPKRREAVAELLPHYTGDDPEVHWFDDFVDWTREMREDDSRKAFPELEEALKGLGQREDEPRPRMKARRLFAIALAQRAFPEMRDPESDLAALARDALHVEGLATNQDGAQRLLQLLGEPVPDGDLARPEALTEWWANLMQTAAAEGLIADPEAIGPRPCTGRLVEVDLPGGPRDVATLKTYFETDKVDFKSATRFLEPSNWPKCSDFWCEMKKIGEPQPGVHRYHEVVSVDCDYQATTWTLQADLDFKYWGIDGVVAVAEYQLPGEQAQPGNVLVDEGSLVVRRLGAAAPHKLGVTTTKRVLFDRVFDGRALALMMCALGYAEVAHDFVFHCAALPKKQARGTKFPGQAPAVAPPEEPSPELAPIIKAVADDAAASVKACIDELAETAQTSSERIEKGKYTADDAVGDMAKTSARLLRHSAAAVDVGLRGARMARRPRARDPSED